MEEGDPVPAGARTRFAVDRLEPLCHEVAEGRGKVGNGPGHVVETRAAAVQEPTHRGVRGGRFEELDAAEERHPDPLASDLLDGGTGFPGKEFKDGDRFPDGRYGDGDVMEWKRHDRNVPVRVGKAPGGRERTGPKRELNARRSGGMVAFVAGIQKERAV